MGAGWGGGRRKRRTSTCRSSPLPPLTMRLRLSVRFRTWAGDAQSMASRSRLRRSRFSRIFFASFLRAFSFSLRCLCF